jgi:hypothetical protein
LSSLRLALVVKVVSVTLGYIACACLLMLGNMGEGGTEGALGDTLRAYIDLSPSMQGYVLYSIPAFCALANLAFAMVAMGVQKDWIVVLSAGNSEWLVGMNSMMTQIDLASKALAPALTGFVFSYCSYGTSAIVMLGLNMVVTVVFYSYLVFIFNSFPALWTRAPPSSSSSSQGESAPLKGNSTTSTTTIPAPGNSFLTSGCAGTMFAYAALYFTVLSFGSLMTVYLR